MRDYITFSLCILILFFTSCGLIKSGSKGSPTHKLNGILAEKVIKVDPTPPKNHLTIKSLQEIKSKDSKVLDSKMIQLESFDARISANEGSISFTFFEPYTNSYLTEINRKSVTGIQIKKDSLSCKILNFKLTQTIDGKRSPQSIAFIMDHCGSMGDDRANILQSAVDSAINQKHPDDEITLIKFDNKATKIITSKNKNTIQSMLRPISGLTGYGYTTAIQDAIGIAIESLKQSTVKDKSIVLLTDGYENSSTVSTDLKALLSIG